jgi:hypothetical protein
MPTVKRQGLELGRSESARAEIQMSDSPFTGPNKVVGKVCVSLRKMNLRYKISPGIGLSNNRAVEIRCLKALQLMRQQVSRVVVVVSSNDVQETSERSTIKQFQMIEAPVAYFPDGNDNS